MDTTIDLCDDSLSDNSTLVLDEIQVCLKKNSSKKTRISGKKLDDTIEIISSDEEDNNTHAGKT
jgi:hypothetical protein